MRDNLFPGQRGTTVVQVNVREWYSATKAMQDIWKTLCSVGDSPRVRISHRSGAAEPTFTVRIILAVSPPTKEQILGVWKFTIASIAWCARVYCLWENIYVKEHYSVMIHSFIVSWRKWLGNGMRSRFVRGWKIEPLSVVSKSLGEWWWWLCCQLLL